MKKNIPVSLEEATSEMITKIENFKKWYLEQNKINPEHFPLELPHDNAGAWFEMMIEWDED